MPNVTGGDKSGTRTGVTEVQTRGSAPFNYNFCDWKPGHRDRGGDFGFDVLYFKLSGSYRNIILSADYRFYSKDFGGPMLKYGWIGYQFNDKSQMQL